ncbi:MAG: AAA family ATPase [Pseudomonadales bacterium]
MTTPADLLAIETAISTAIVGQPGVARQLLIGLLCNGNLLLEGLPGTAKTRSVKALAQILDISLNRIQFTPDLLPSDVTGTEVFHSEGDQQTLVFQPGPLFANLVLADEINRAPAKVQSALLEAMEERQVTVAGKTYPMPDLFMVLATQNPIDQEGTYPLPEAQTDRFLMKVLIEYPDDDAELDVIRLVRSEEGGALRLEPANVSEQDIFEARAQLKSVHVSEQLERYMVDIIMASRHPDRYSGSEISHWLSAGASPRASIALDRASRAVAWLSGKDYVDPDDVRSVAHAVLRHRLTASYEALAGGISQDDIVDEILRQVASA